ncbi:Chitin-inducible gibberellin-responsive protein 2 [Hibiscus syriacus]|uniref:Chitin-inducible gibberellin-responsive protein 2 n=1 Tax=Hibiscus syriacus TaxID=106335 RepID=A0A6A2XK51_HIBSY|nr:scarecrow-like protein 21 [Hibiscus syriacus]KAE8654194.1 Chitin-inducible gibberellin-responsive protein 2 [Hibiscus syriacus]
MCLFIPCPAPMQMSQKPKISGTYFDQPVKELESYCLPPNQSLDQYQSGSDDGSNGVQQSVHNPDQYCTLDSSSGMQNSSSTASFSPDGSPVSQQNYSYPSNLHHSPEYTCGSPISGSCVIDNENALGHMIRQLETAMLGSDLDNFDLHSIAASGRATEVSTEAERWKYMMEMIARGDLKELLCACAKAIENKDMYVADCLITQLHQMVSVSGEPIQRLGAYMVEGLVARLASSGSSIYKALRCKEPASVELLSYMHILYEICPYFKFGYMSANGAIAEAMKEESRVHIIDFQIAQGSQWLTLIHALASRPGGPPSIRITGIDDPTSSFARGGGLEIVGQRLRKLAESCKVPFEFHAAAISGTEVQLENLRIQPDEAIAVNFAMMLHHMPDESVGTENHRDRLLRLVKSLSPKVVTLVEQEANTNTAPFLPRFMETMGHYLAIFESIDVSLPREHKERIKTEQHCLAREIVNIIACEGPERVERHELLGKWRSRFIMAGFTPSPLSSFVNNTIKTLLQSYCDKYTLEERDDVLYLGWMNRAIVESCAWRC